MEHVCCCVEPFEGLADRTRSTFLLPPFPACQLIFYWTYWRWDKRAVDVNYMIIMWRVQCGPTALCWVETGNYWGGLCPSNIITCFLSAPHWYPITKHADNQCAPHTLWAGARPASMWTLAEVTTDLWPTCTWNVVQAANWIHNQRSAWIITAAVFKAADTQH